MLVTRSSPSSLLYSVLETTARIIPDHAEAIKRQNTCREPLKFWQSTHLVVDLLEAS
jgi:ABC-type transport system involved in cytochrome c biogenesis ATPase subunit